MYTRHLVLIGTIPNYFVFQPRERYEQYLNTTCINAYVANGGWVPRSQGAGTTNPNPG